MHINDYGDARHFIGVRYKDMFSIDVVIIIWFI